jgi:hypothetical protein
LAADAAKRAATTSAERVEERSVVRYLLIGMALGVLTEASANRLRLWVYRRPLTPVINVPVMFGAVLGGIGAGVPV